MATGTCWQAGKSLAEVNKHMMESRLGADVEFCVGVELTAEGTQTFLVHKYILVSRSPVFETMFYGSFDHPPGKAIEIPDVSPRAFKVLLEFVYCDHCTIEDTDLALSLIYASKKYMLTSLTEAAVKYVSEHITADNVCLVLERCSKLDEFSIVNQCLAFLQCQAYSVVKRDSFMALSKASLKYLLESDSMCILESDLLVALLRWGKKKAKKESGQGTAGGPSGWLDQVRDLLPLIRFPLVPYKALQGLNAKCGGNLLSSDEMLILFELMTGKLRPSLLTETSSSSGASNSSKCGFHHHCSNLRGHSSAVRFSIAEDFQLSSLVKREEQVQRKFTLKFKPLKQNMTVFAVTVMTGPYLIRATIHDPGGQLVSYTEKDMRDWGEAECCKETCLVLQEPVVMCCKDLEDPYELVVYISDGAHMYWYDNVIQGKYTENSHLKLKYSNPEIISQIHFLLT